ncbi:uncharacterized protein G2W53_028629 [Senna tora]|uniref:Uncharacterized protein n=1 Tax=Senna tora TaxID=362788 RepID=A0A834T327_9FABA|nr:uncharacterized protein G2W53_028629 [Senna tora]
MRAKQEPRKKSNYSLRKETDKASASKLRATSLGWSNRSIDLKVIDFPTIPELHRTRLVKSEYDHIIRCGFPMWLLTIGTNRLIKLEYDIEIWSMTEDYDLAFQRSY